MSRAFVNEDAAGPDDAPRFVLPPADDPGYDAAAALAMLEGAREGHTSAAEEATGYRWGDPALAAHIERLIEGEMSRPADERDRRLVQVGRRYLRALTLLVLLLACGSGEEPSADGAETDTVSAEPAATRGADAAPGPAPVTIDVYIREGAIAAGLDRAGVIARFGEPDSVVRIAVPNRHDPAVTDSVVTLRYAGARYVFYVVTAGGGYDILDGAEVESNEHLRHTAPGIGTPEASLRAWFGEHGVERERELEYDCASCEVPQPVTFELDADDRVRRIRFDYYVD